MCLIIHIMLKKLKKIHINGLMLITIILLIQSIILHMFHLFSEDTALQMISLMKNTKSDDITKEIEKYFLSILQDKHLRVIKLILQNTDIDPSFDENICILTASTKGKEKM